MKVKTQNAVSPTEQTLKAFIRKVDWNLCRDFLSIVEYGGIGAAARATSRQQPSLSAALKRFENHIGFTLCSRSSRGIELTPSGKVVFELCREMAGCVMAIPQHAAAAAGCVDGTLRLSMVADLGIRAIDDAIIMFHEIYPAVSLHIDVAPWRDTIEAVVRGDADIGISCDNAPRDSLRYVPIGREEQQLYCHASSRIFQELKSCSSDLKQYKPQVFSKYNFVLTGNDEPQELFSFRKRHGLGGHIGGQADTLSEARRLIRLGVGIGFLPTDFAAGDVLSGQLIPLLPEDILPRYPIYMITRAETPDGTAASLIVNVIISRTAGKEMQKSA